MKDNNLIEKEFSTNIFYLNSKLNDFSFPESFQIFKEKIFKVFNFPSNEIEKLNFFYEKEKEKYFNIKTEEEYKNEITKIKAINKNKNLDIYIEFNNNNNDDFEENIKMLVENEIKNASDRIINGLRFKNRKYKELKKQDKICEECNNFILGDIFIKVDDDKEIYYCEKCSFDIEEPLFIVH